jgi:hypothetical protein
LLNYNDNKPADKASSNKHAPAKDSLLLKFLTAGNVGVALSTSIVTPRVGEAVTAPTTSFPAPSTLSDFLLSMYLPRMYKIPPILPQATLEIVLTLQKRGCGKKYPL